jgi:integration host factor subunit beta
MEISGTLTKANLSRHLMNTLGLTKKDSDILVNTFLNSIIAALRAGDNVELRGFGSFRLRERKPRIGRNPRSGQSIHVPSKRVVFFKLGKDLKAKMVEPETK